MTNRELLLRDGYLLFDSVVPTDLCQEAAENLNADPRPALVWTGDVAARFRQWGQQFLTDQQMDFHGWPTDIHIFNRRPGTDGQFWHDDDQLNHPFYKQGHESHGRRVFCCTYFVSTFGGRAPLRVIPNSHHGGYADFRIRFTTMRLQMSDVAPFKGYTGDVQVDYPDMWGSHPDEKVIECNAGSMIICEERILHGTDINRTDERRPMALWWLEKNKQDRAREREFAAAAGVLA